MLKALLTLVRLVASVPVVEFAGAALIVAGVYGLAGGWWAAITAGVLLLVKAFDLSLPKVDA